ncbi:vWA domain-containing protein [Abyssisolibacter fermentans]|uniref:vWA domain-containing protein n=1 Tax=Abyssisolibacter fermentans TaxID=1766203 RepID=UPI00082A14E0|nr:vWA domain-containing protein [Abyssisolibacter fermentans]
MEKNIEFKQIILVTDGKSNKGINPITVAENAVNSGISISTIGIIEGSKDKEYLQEIKGIAKAGRGLWEITDIEDLEKSICLLTKQTVCKTIEQAVNKELQAIIGKELQNIEPDSRKKIINFIEKIEDGMTIKCSVVLDCSKSMTNKIEIAKKSIISLLRNLSERKGKTFVSVIAYPCDEETDSKIISNLTNDIKSLEKAIKEIEIGGLTPTGSALQAAINLLNNKNDTLKEEGLFESLII